MEISLLTARSDKKELEGLWGPASVHNQNTWLKSKLDTSGELMSGWLETSKQCRTLWLFFFFFCSFFLFLFFVKYVCAVKSKRPRNNSVDRRVANSTNYWGTDTCWCCNNEVQVDRRIPVRIHFNLGASPPAVRCSAGKSFHFLAISTESSQEPEQPGSGQIITWLLFMDFTKSNLIFLDLCL